MNILKILPVLPVLGLLTACSSGSSQPTTLSSVQTQNPWYQQGQKSIAEKLSVLDLKQRSKAKNVIVFLGDGMGISTLTAARILQGQLKGESGEENTLSFEHFPFTGLSKTYNTDQQTPDSAGTMSAIMTGIKTDAGVLSIDETVEKGNCQSAQGHELTTALESAELMGKATGIVSTARITHATPAATYAKSPHRNWENDAKVPESEKACKDIALQLIEFQQTLASKYPNFNSNGIEVILGGGRRNFLPNDIKFNEENPNSETAEGKRKDGRHLINEWRDLYPSGAYVNNQKGLFNQNTLNSSHIFGLFNPSHMRYEQDRSKDTLGEPSLSEMTSVAIDKLAQNSKGYFLMVEAGRIDHSHHAGNAYNALHDTIELSNAVELALSKVDLSETLIIVTADHSHVMTMAGYPKRGNPILGKVVAPNETQPTLMEDGLPYTTLGYLNGRGMHDLKDETDADASYDKPINVGRKDISKIDTAQPGYHQEALHPRGSETHGGEDVGIYAIGPGAHLVSGVNEQNVIYHVMMYASGM
ncbi:alkaline phosphatase [Oceaniserpentilla sp. 4NH20-0058]|uniref:alkaline phosphatase n=1 Tax=Oceaniserpentilla sp. 4NH20-0058 TaxID=3127660 RepID=UPI003103853D